MSINIIGLSAFFHDSACCLLQDGQLVAAAEEERFSRIKHDSSLPVRSFQFCLNEAGLTLPDIHAIAYFEDPRKKASRQQWTKKETDIELVSQKPEFMIREFLGFAGPIEYVDHHMSHAASGFCFSGFESSAILTVDGVGEWATTTYGKGDTKKGIQIFEEVSFPNSLGLLYSTFTNYLGFSVNDGEYKVMGLAPYGRPLYKEQIWSMIKMQKNGRFALNMKYFDFSSKDKMFSDNWIELFEMGPRSPESDILQFHKDLSSSIQSVLEDIMIEKCEYLYSKTKSKNLCLAGGVALNCVANRKILEKSSFENLFVPPAPGDSGACLGAAKIVHDKITNEKSQNTRLQRTDWGPSYSEKEIQNFFESTGIQKQDFCGRRDELLLLTAQYLFDGKIVGWFQGRMEFGPRSLGHRSILANPQIAGIRERVNRSIKKRELFRPFAPAVVAEEARKYFNLNHPIPFMTETCEVLSKAKLPSVTHVDGSARAQTVDKKSSPLFHSLLREFQKISGLPILLNTSFNLRGEPIVCHFVDALWCFVRSEMDVLVIENYLIKKEDIPSRWLEFGEIWDSRVKSNGTTFVPPTTGVYTFF